MRPGGSPTSRFIARTSRVIGGATCFVGDAAVTALAAYVSTHYDGDSPWDRAEDAARGCSRGRLRRRRHRRLFVAWSASARCGACHARRCSTATSPGYHRVQVSTATTPAPASVDPASRRRVRDAELRGRRQPHHAVPRRPRTTPPPRSRCCRRRQRRPALDEPPARGRDRHPARSPRSRRSWSRSCARCRRGCRPRRPACRRGAGAPSMPTGGWRGELEVAVGGVQLRGGRSARSAWLPSTSPAHFDGRGRLPRALWPRGVPLAGIHGFGGDRDVEGCRVPALVDRRRGSRSSTCPATAAPPTCRARGWPSVRTPRRCCACSITPASTAP